MCGLFGVYSPGGLSGDEIGRADRARDTLRHRGPDRAGKWVTGGLYHGFRRLSIIDLSEAGSQPMVSDDRQVSITVNGEIYNYRDLREDLAASGCVFSSRSDSEVVLHGYRQWGLERLSEKLDGMYAAVIHDAGRGRICAIRDRAGMKPFFYWHSGRNFAWASELKALEAWLGANLPPVDETAILDFLAAQYIPAPKTLYRDIAKLPPASHLTFDLASGGATVRRYWTVETEPRSGNHDALAEELRSRIDASVKAHMVSDVPLGYFLSGGVDSGIILSHGVRHGAGAKAFSIGFEDAEIDESAAARVTARKFAAEHAIRLLTPADAEGVVGRTSECYDEPFSDKAALPIILLSEFARREVTVVLSGDGGDELFGGYRWYRRFNKIRRMQRIFPFGKPGGFATGNSSLRLLSTRDPVELCAVVRLGMPKLRRDLYRERLAIPADYDELWHLRQWWRPELGRLRSLQYLDFHTSLPNNILTKVDRLTMLASLEARIPLLAKDVVEFAFSLPQSFIYKGGIAKGGLKYAYRNVLPPEILSRRKQGFGLPASLRPPNTVAPGQSYQESILAEFVRSGKLKENLVIPAGNRA